MPQIQIELPEALRPLADGAAVLPLQAATVRAALAELGRRHPQVLSRVLTRGGALRPHVNLFLNQQDLRLAQGLETPVREGDQLAVVAAVSGG